LIARVRNTVTVQSIKVAGNINFKGRDYIKRIITIAIILLTLAGALNSSYGVSNQDRQLLYRAVEAEVTGASYEDKLRVANVILNRVNSSVFPNTIRKVIYQKNQFCIVRDNRINTVKVTDISIKAVDDALAGKWIMSDKVLYFNVRGLNSWASRNKIKWGSDSVHDFYY